MSEIKIKVTPTKSKNLNIRSNNVKNSVKIEQNPTFYYSTLAKQWAVLLGNKVQGEDYSSKQYAEYSKQYADNALNSANVAESYSNTINSNYVTYMEDITAVRDETIAEVQELQKEIEENISPAIDKTMADIENARVESIDAIVNTKSEAIDELDKSEKAIIDNLNLEENNIIINLKDQEYKSKNSIIEVSETEYNKIVDTGIDTRSDLDLSNLSVEGEKHFANPSLTNLTPEGEAHFLGQRNISNNINSAPELVKWKLEDGVLTLLAGSIARWAAGTQAPTLNIGDLFHGMPIVDISWDGTRLIYYTQTQQDYSWTFKTYTGYVQMFLQDAENAPFWGLQTDMIYSGTNNTVTTDNRVFYDTDDNTCVHARDNIAQSFPLMKCFLNGASGITTVCNTYQTGGCIGSTIWFNKNVSGNAVNKINSECGLASIEFTTEYDYFVTLSSDLTRTNGEIFFVLAEPPSQPFQGIGFSTVQMYNASENYLQNTISGNTPVGTQCLIGTNLTIVNGQIQSYTPRMPFRAADAQDLSGQLIFRNTTLINSTTFTPSETKTYSVANYLPKDGKMYEVFLNMWIRTGAAVGNSIGIKVLSDVIPNEGLRICRCQNNVANRSATASGSVIIPVGAQRTLQFYSVDSNGTSGNCGCMLVGFRKVR